MSAISDSDSETEVISRNLCGVVDIGSNGIRFSISSKASHHARIMPCVFKDRVGISLFEVQYAANSLEKAPIPTETIDEVCAAMKRFKLICDDFGVPETGVRVVATEATREAINSQSFTSAIYESTGWDVELLTKEEEGRIGAYGVISSFNSVSGLYMDLGGGSTQLSWIRCTDGDITMSPTPVSLPYGAGALSRRVKIEEKRELFEEIKEAYRAAFEKIQVPKEMVVEAQEKGGFELFTCGGGLRGMGHLLLSQIKEYPIQTIINGFSCSYEEFSSMADYLMLKGRVPGCGKIFKVSERRALQLPAIGLLMSAAFESLPAMKTIHFSEGGVREGTLYSILPREIRAKDPLHIATRPYAPLLAGKYLELLREAIPENEVPGIVYKRIAPALCNLAFVHASYPKELQPTAALHVATTGIIAGCHGLSHRARALIGIALCNRWGGDIPEQDEEHKKLLEDVVLRDGNKLERQRIVWWTKYIGTIMFVICGVHPGGNIRDGVFNFDIKQKIEPDKDMQGLTLDESTTASNSKKREFEISVVISKDDLKTSASVRARIITLQKKIRKLSRGSSEKVKVGVKFYEND
ncbi:LAMI_0D01530g1_1 [Lachancea mirantina]|uniref:LAMI_0D01530g1_1 n=1 Tax=Lachancea mirantina TaxID=1230905 RepID=A0A1G4J8Q0_9SACH|nr:LAMI_0D01530g1_1 [Lachancea mirantina]